MTHECCTLTTVDNPFDPFEQFDSWFMFDIEKGYYSCAKMARLMEANGISIYDSSKTREEIEAETEKVIDNFIRLDFTDTYKKVKRPMTE